MWHIETLGLEGMDLHGTIPMELFQATKLGRSAVVYPHLVFDLLRLGELINASFLVFHII